MRERDIKVCPWLVITEQDSSLSEGLGYTTSGYKVEGKDLEAILGPLEADVLNAVYAMGRPVRVRDVYEGMRKARKIAYTTVMSTMNTLYEKGILDRKVTNSKGGLLYVYWPKMSKEEMEKTAVKQILDSLIQNFGDAVTSYLTELDKANKKGK